MPRSTSASSSLALLPVRDRGRIGAARDAGTALDRLLDGLPGAREHLGGLGLELGRRVRHVHAVGEVGGRHEERAALDEQLQGLVAHQRAVLDAVEAGLDRRADAVVTVGVRRDLEPGAVRLVGDRGELLVRVLLGARRARCATSRRRTRRP